MRPPRATRVRLWIPLVASLGAVLVLIVAAGSFSYSASLGLQSEVHRLVRNAERSTFLIGDLGQIVARLHSNLLESVDDRDGEDPERRERVLRLTRSLNAHAAELPALLSAEEWEIWATIGPEIEEYARRTRQILDHGEDGVGASDLELERLAATKRRVLDALAASMELNQRETAQMVARADRLLARERKLDLAVPLLLFVAIAVIALLALSALRRRERELAGYVAALEGANRDLEAFAGRVAHDLRTAIAPMRLAGAILRVPQIDPGSAAATGERMERASRRAEGVISGLLAFARAGAPVNAGACSGLVAELAATIEELGSEIQRVGATVTTELEDGLRVRCDPALLRVVLGNLLSNAVKFLEGRPLREVRVRARAVAEHAEIEVSDTGPGIPETARERVFEPFFRVPGATASGHGIGLATVRRVVEGHGGSIRLRPGTGTTFVVALPRAADPAAASASPIGRPNGRALARPRS